MNVGIVVGLADGRVMTLVLDPDRPPEAVSVEATRQPDTYFEPGWPWRLGLGADSAVDVTVTLRGVRGYTVTWADPPLT